MPIRPIVEIGKPLQFKRAKLARGATDGLRLVYPPRRLRQHRHGLLVESALVRIEPRDAEIFHVGIDGSIVELIVVVVRRDLERLGHFADLKVDDDLSFDHVDFGRGASDLVVGAWVVFALAGTSRVALAREVG